MSGVRVERAAGRATITIDRPEAKNAISRAVMDALGAALDSLASDESLCAVIFTGAGSTFVAGGDLRDFAQIPDGPEGHAMSRRMNGVIARLAALPCPVIAAIDGDAYGGGCEIALACDLRVLARSARLCFRQVAMGLTPGWGGGQRLARLVGTGTALRIYATAATVEGDEALRLGLVDAVAEGTALSVATDWASAMARQSPLAVRNVKRALAEGRDLPLAAAIERESELFAETWGSPPHRAAVARFLKRRG